MVTCFRAASAKDFAKNAGCLVPLRTAFEFVSSPLDLQTLMELFASRQPLMLKTEVSVGLRLKVPVIDAGRGAT
jgi:hypothetical protein